MSARRELLAYRDLCHGDCPEHSGQLRREALAFMAGLRYEASCRECTERTTSCAVRAPHR